MSEGGEDAGAEFHEGLDALGFVFVQLGVRGGVQFARAPNRFLTEWVHDHGTTALFTWEFAFGDWARAQGWQAGTSDTSAQVLYPTHDVWLERDIDAVAVEIQRLESRLARLDLSHPQL